MIVIDVEFSGLDAIKDSIVSIGAVELENPQNQFYGECRIWPDAHINEDALAVNGFTKEQIKDPKKWSDEELIKAFISWTSMCKEHTFAGQNPSLDMEFIRNGAKRYHMDWGFAHRTVDLHSLCYMHMVKKGIMLPVLNNRTDLNSDKIMKYVGIPAEPHPHNALNGAKFEAEAISRLLYDKKLLPEFEKYSIPWIA
jgi:DNA polymerase III epsilon subunit-like protein